MELRAGDFVTDAVRLVRPLAEGGMGRVWVAEHLGLHTQVVVKLMAREMAAREDGATRFAREAAVAAAIKSPHVVQVFDHGVTKTPGASLAGVPYIVMELLEGRDLGAVLEERGRLEPNEAAQVVVQVGKALAKAHRAGIVHRDVKPENIFLCDPHEGDEEGTVNVKLLDFGTAKQEKAPLATIPGEIMGTPYYMSPEQAIGATVDPRTDMWSLGVVAFEMLTGTKPFEGANVGAIALAIHAGLPPLVSRVCDLPPALDGWFERACAQLPHERFATMREMTASFVEALTGVAPAATEATEAIVLPRRISVRPSRAPSSPDGRASSDEMRKTLPTSIEPSIPPPSHPHPAFSETASFGSAGLTSEGAVALDIPLDLSLARRDGDGRRGDERGGDGRRGDRRGSEGLGDGRPGDGASAMLDSIAPLSATLPDRHASQRPTRIAAGLVGVAAAGMMAFIVMHSSPTPSASATAAAAAASPPPVATHATSTSAAPPAAAADPMAPPEASEPASGDAPTPTSMPVAPKKGKRAATSGSSASPTNAPSTPAKGGAGGGAAGGGGKKGAAKGEDDDLAKLLKAGTDASTPSPAPTPLPPKTPSPAPTPVPPKSEPPRAPAPAPTPLPPSLKAEAPTGS